MTLMQRPEERPARRQFLCNAGAWLAGVAVWPTGCRSRLPVLEVVRVDAFTLPPLADSLPAPRTLTCDRHGRILVLDDGGRVLRFFPDRTLDTLWPMPASEIGNPEGVCVLRDGRILVADTHYDRVVVFSDSGELLETWGTKGDGPGQFQWPVAVAEDDRGFVYVAEYGGRNRVQKFDASGRFLTAWGGHGTKPGLFQRPSGMVWLDGALFVADAFNNRIQVFDDDGRLLRILPPEVSDWIPSYPYDIAAGQRDDLFVVEYRAGCVTRLDPQGRCLGRFGSPGSALGQFHTPWGLTLPDVRTVWVADTGNRRIVELRLQID